VVSARGVTIAPGGAGARPLPEGAGAG
jgi:hypothetical protein